MGMAMGMATGMEMKTELSLATWTSAAALLLLSQSAVAQQQTLPGAIPTSPTGVTSSSAAGATQLPPADNTTKEEPGVPQRAWIISPRVALTETLTDNANLNGLTKQEDIITELVPGIRIEAKTERLKGYFDYALHEQYYERSNFSRNQNSLNTFGTLEAIDHLLFLDFSGVIAQQTISAFGTQSPSNTTINSNSTETATYRLSPYLRGQLAGTVDYYLRYNTSITRANSSSVSDIDLKQWAGQLKGSTVFKNLQWTLDGNQQTADYSLGRNTDADSLRAMLTYSVLPDFRLSGSFGRETNNYASLDQESTTTHGYGFDWTPTERTQFSVFKEKRFFGNAQNINISHRFPQSSIQYTDTRDVSFLPNQFVSTGLGNIYNLYFEQFASLIPDPTARANFVNALLAQYGINPNTQVTSDFLASQVTVQHRQQLALAMTGVRNTITLLFNRTESQSVLGSNTPSDNLSQATSIRQQGVNLNIAHRLTELSTLNLLGSRQESTGNSASTNLKTTIDLYQVNVSTKLSAKTTGSLSVRHTKFDSTINPYTENALLGTVSYIY